MTRGHKICLFGLSGLLALLAAALAFVATFDWNRVRPLLNDKVSAALGRPFAINGELRVLWLREPEQGGWRALLPWPHFSASDLALGNPAWVSGKAGDAPFAHLERVEFRLSPLPLLWHQVVIPQVRLTRPSVQLLRLADGRANWNFTLPASDGEPASPWALAIGKIGFDQGRIGLDDQRLQAQLVLQVDTLGKPVPFADLAGKSAGAATAPATQDYVFGWKAHGSYQGLPLSGAGKLGGVLALEDASRPFPLQAEVKVGDTRVAVLGTLVDPLNLGALDLRLKLAGNSMANLYPLTGVTLPDTPAYATDGRLQALLKDPGGARFDYRNFNGKVGESDLHGSLSFVAGQPRPKLSGKLTSEQLRMADLGPLIGADSNSAKRARGQSSRQPADKLLPVEAFRTERWRTMDADVAFSGKRILHSDKLPISDLQTHLVLADGLLRLEPLRFGVAGGSLNARVRLDGGKTPLRSEVELQARGFKLKQLFPGFEAMQTSLGELNGDASLSGSGNSVAAILGGADGDLRLVIHDGRISKGLMEIAGLNLGNYVVAKLFGDDDVKINCAVADIGVNKGLATPRLFAFDTENAIVNVEGTANFANEKLDLDVIPHSKGVRLFSLRSPLYVQGTFKNPKAGVHTGPLLARGAGMLALGAVAGPAAGLLALVAPSKNDDNECAPLLAQLKAPGRR